MTLKTAEIKYSKVITLPKSYFFLLVFPAIYFLGVLKFEEE